MMIRKFSASKVEKRHCPVRRNEMDLIRMDAGRNQKAGCVAPLFEVCVLVQRNEMHGAGEVN